jgi:hypothetical protein
MKLVVSSRADAAADVLQAHVDFHLGAGADVVLLHGSEVPAGIAAHARVQTVGPGTAALLAAVEAAEPDWLIEGEAREFWWPRGGSLKELLSPLSQRFASVRALPREFVAVDETTAPFWEHRTHRFARGSAQPRFVRRRAAAAADSVRGWVPIEVLRFPADSGDRYDDEALRRGVREGLLTVDTRIRDALRSLAAGDPPDFGRADVTEEARFAADLASLGEADLAEMRDRLEGLELRLSVLESNLAEVVKRKLRRLRRRR